MRLSFRTTCLRVLCLWTALLAGAGALARPVSEAELAGLVNPPFALGPAIGEGGVHSLLNSGGAPAGYVFQTEPLAPLPGFSGTPVNLMVTLDLGGRFLEVRLLDHNEPIFVSGLGEAPFHRFFAQYAGLSIWSPIVVGAPHATTDAGTPLTRLDGVSKATASVRIAHESVMAAALAVAREKMRGIAAGPPARPDPDHAEDLDWAALVAQGIVTRHVISNAEVEAGFAGTLWEGDDAGARADPAAPYLDLRIVDLGPPAIARAVLAEETLAELRAFREISPEDEPILLIETARHGLVSEDFVRNTAPDRLSAEQDGLPVALRDSDLAVVLSPDLPAALHEGRAMILRIDRRLGFDPAREWTLLVEAVRQHGMFRPETGRISLPVPHRTDARFFLRPGAAAAPPPPWQAALRDRRAGLAVLAVFLAGLMAVLAFAERRLADPRVLGPARLLILVFVTGFIGWWGQGQLSIVTVLGVLRALADGGSLAFLGYDPFSLLLWGAALAGLVLWGRGFFCGWLCPFGALQEGAHHLGRRLGLPRIEPSEAWDARLKYLKYVLLAMLAAVALLAPDAIDHAAEIEPFKTAITTYFDREWYYVAYAAFWLLAGLVLFKGFCRYVCPLGAMLALGGLLRGRDWIARRPDCGSPCQLCRVKCNYGAITRRGAVRYDECFACLDCVSIHDDPARCVPLVLAARRGRDGGRIGAREAAE